MDTTLKVEKTFVTSKGISLTLKPVSQFKLDTLRASKVEVPVPTYTANLAGGGKQEFPLDEEIARNKNRLPEWKVYLEERAEIEAEHAKRFLELMIWEGLDVEIPGIESEWQKSSEYFGLKIPPVESPIERKLFYVYNELLGTPEDIGNLIAQIFAVSQIDQEAVEQLRASFRAGIQRQANKRVSKGKKPLENRQPGI